MWGTPLTELVDGTIKYFPGDDFDERWAADIDTGVSQHAHELKSFQQVLDSEHARCRSVYNIIMEVINAKAADIHCCRRRGSATRKTRFRTLSIQSLNRNPSAASKCRPLYIEASLHAAFRWNKTRRFKPNDMHDFHHACAALAYCRLDRTVFTHAAANSSTWLHKLFLQDSVNLPSALAHLRDLKSITGA